MFDDYIKELSESNALNYTEGRFELFGLRGVMLPAPTMFSFLRRMAGRHGSEVKELMYRTGVDHGDLAIEEVGRAHEVSKREFVENLIRTGNIMGLGRIELKDYSLERGELKLKVVDPPRDEEMDESELVVMEFWRGVFGRISEELFDSDVETKVISRDGSYTIHCSRA